MAKQFILEDATITSAAEAIAEGSLSVIELVSTVLEQAEATEPELHAYVRLDGERALDAAEIADRELSERGPRGPLHGIPIGVKDLLATKDLPTEAGSKLFASYQPANDADVVQKLRAAGAIILGKQHTHEFGLGMNEPPTRTPWDLGRYPGGSTVGGGVSVAVGSSLAAVGTDGGGSIRKPASINGVVGLKPTLGRISTNGIYPGAISVDHVGWITRSVADSELMLSVLSDAPREAMSRGIAEMRLGCTPYFFSELDPDIEDRVWQCLDALTELGAVIVWFELPELESASRVHSILASSASSRLHQPWITTTPELYHPGSLRSLELGSRFDDHEVQAARLAREELTTAMERAFADNRLDVMCTPTLAIPPVPLSDMDPELMLPLYTKFTIPFNLSGQPAISVPCGLDGNGLPVGFQLAGRAGGETTIFQIAQAIEATRLWSQPRSMGAVACSER